MKLKKNLRTILGVIILVLVVVAALNGKNIFAGDNMTGTTQSDNFGEIADTSQTTTPTVTTPSETTTEKDSEKTTATQPESTTAPTTQSETTTEPATTGPRIAEDGEYTTKEDVAEYLYLYKHLPSNFITKDDAKKLGWVSNEGNLWKVAPGKSIGGDYFGNFEGILPKKSGRKYYECDIDFEGKYRNSKRIVYSNDGLIYYTDDHYESFDLLYGEE